MLGRHPARLLLWFLVLLQVLGPSPVLAGIALDELIAEKRIQKDFGGFPVRVVGATDGQSLVFSQPGGPGTAGQWIAGAGGGPPSGAAGGDLSGTYPNPLVHFTHLDNGSAAAPSLTFSANTNRGLYNDTVNSAVGVTVGGAEVAYFTATGLSVLGKLTVTGAIDPTSVSLSSGTALFFDSADGSTAPVAPVSHGRIRYLDGTGWQVSSSGGAYTTLPTSAATLQSAYNAGATIATSGAVPIAFSDTAADNADVLTVTKNPAGAQSGNGVSVSMGATTTGTGVSITSTAGATGAPLNIVPATGGFIRFGTADAFARNQIWHTGASSIFRMGADTADGDPSSIDSEGIVVYHPTGDQLGRMKADRFALTRASDSSLNYFRVDQTSLFYRANPPGGTIHFFVDRSTGFAGFETGAPVGTETWRQTGGKALHDFTSTAALTVAQTGGGTPVLVADTTNTRLGVGAAPGAFTLDVTGTLHVSGKATIDGALDPTSLSISGTASYVDQTDGTASAVSPAAHGRLIYNNTTKTLQVSADGGAYTSITTGTLSLQSAYNGGATIATSGAVPIAFSDTNDDAGNVLNLTKTPASSQSGNALSVSMGANTTDAGIFLVEFGSGLGIFVQTGSGTIATGIFSQTNGSGAAIFGQNGSPNAGVAGRFEDTGANDADVVVVNKTPTSAHSGHGLSVAMGSNATGSPVSVTTGASSGPGIVVNDDTAQGLQLVRAAATARTWRVDVSSAGALELYDVTAGAARLSISTAGKVTIPGILDPTMVLLTGADKRFGATDAGTVYLAPFADSATGIQIRKADNVTALVTVDTSTGFFGVGATAPSFGEFSTFQKSVNSAAVLNVYNPTAGTLASAAYVAQSDTSFWTIGHTSSAFTPGSGLVANEGFLYTGVASTSLVVMTTGSNPIRFSTDATERARFLGTGELVYGATTVFGTEKVRIVGATRIEGKLTVTGIIDPTMVLLSGADKRFGATDAGTVYLAPFTDSATGIQIRKSDNVTALVTVDTTTGNSTFATGWVSSPGAGASSERFGNASVAAGAQGTALGGTASAAGLNSTAVGFGSSAGSTASIALGRSTATTAANQLVVGSTTGPVAEFILGSRGDTSATATAVTWRISNGSGGNMAGTDLTVIPGRSTGTGVGGSFIVQTSPAGGAGATLNAAVTRFTISGNGSLTAAGATAVNFTSTSALTVNQTGGGTNALTVDTTNTRVGVGAAPGAFTLDVTGTLHVSGKATIDGALDPTSLSITGTASYVDQTNGTAAAVAPAGHGRLIYNDTTKTLQFSADGSAYTSLAAGGSVVASLQVNGATTPSAGQIRSRVDSASAGVFPSVILERTRSAGAVSSGDILGAYYFLGGVAGGPTLNYGAVVSCTAIAAVSNSVVPSRVTFAVAEAGGTIPDVFAVKYQAATVASNGVFGFSSSATDLSVAADTGISRDTTGGSGFFDFGTGAANSKAGTLQFTNAKLEGTVGRVNAVNTTGWGVPAIYGTGNISAQTTNATIATYTVGGTTGDFQVSATVNVSAATVVSTSINVTYTDAGGTARTLILPVQLVGGTGGTYLTNGLIVTTGDYTTPTTYLRAQNGSTITVLTAAGTFTGVTYSAAATIAQVR